MALAAANKLPAFSNVLRTTKPADFATGQAVLNAFFGDTNQTFYQRLEADQQASLVYDSLVVESQTQWSFPDVWTQVEVNLRRIRNYQRPPALLIKTMKFGSKANFFGDAVSRDLVKVAKRVLLELQMASPVRPASMRKSWGKGSPPGTYRKSHELWLGDGGSRRRVGLGGITSVGPSAYAMITNRTDYASTLETPDFSGSRHHPYQRVFQSLRRSKTDLDWDIRLEYADPAAFGGNKLTSIYTGRYSKRKGPPVYVIPVLTIAPLNTLPKAGTFRSIKRRSAKKRRNLLSRQPWNR